nr:hypothetical protein [Bacteroidales bacterium]
AEKDKTLRYRFHLNNTFSEQLKISSRIEFSKLRMASENSNGIIMYHQFTRKFSERLSLTYRILLFNSPNWNNRIYTYEPGVKYSFSFPAMHGKGSRNILVATLKTGKWGKVRGKIGSTHYAHTISTGSGNEVRAGNKVLDAELQLQIDF